MHAAGGSPQQPGGDIQDDIQQPAQATITSRTTMGFTYSYTSVPPLLRKSQIALYAFSGLQFLLAAISVSAHISYTRDSDDSESAIMIIDAFLLGCSIVGLMAASGRSRIVLGAFVLASLFVIIHSCLLLSFFDTNCEEENVGECHHDDGGRSYYKDSRYRGMIANLAINVVVAIGGILCSTMMLASSFKTNDVRP